jgi:hypothetical protein
MNDKRQRPPREYGSWSGSDRNTKLVACRDNEQMGSTLKPTSMRHVCACKKEKKRQKRRETGRFLIPLFLWRGARQVNDPLI